MYVCEFCRYSRRKWLKTKKERDFGKVSSSQRQSRAARVEKSAICNYKAHACRCALVWAVGPSAGGKSVVVEGVAVHFCTKFALADGMHCNFRPSENSATSPTALATLSLALACHALARRAQWLVNFCKYIHVYLQKLLCLESES